MDDPHGLALNEDKARLRDARCDAFDFLGYTFGPMYSPRTGGRYNGVRPSQKAVASMRDAIRRRLRPGNQAPWELFGELGVLSPLALSRPPLRTR